MRSHSQAVHGVTVLLTLALSSAAAPAADQVKQYPIEEFLRTTNYSGASFSPDNSKILVSGDQTGILNAYALPVDGGPPQSLTRSSKESIFALSYFPSDERFLYTADQGGNELNHLYVREADGTSKDLTPGENLKADFGGWSEDYEHFWVITNERDPRFFDVYRYATDGYDRELIFENKEGWSPSDISRDGRWLALAKPRTSSRRVSAEIPVTAACRSGVQRSTHRSSAS